MHTNVLQNAMSEVRVERFHMGMEIIKGKLEGDKV